MHEINYIFKSAGNVELARLTQSNVDVLWLICVTITSTCVSIMVTLLMVLSAYEVTAALNQDVIYCSIPFH